LPDRIGCDGVGSSGRSWVLGSLVACCWSAGEREGMEEDSKLQREASFFFSCCCMYCVCFVFLAWIWA
jgi:hypothetical protein